MSGTTPGQGPTRLVLVRHGESEWHAENRYAGSSDVGLTDLGRRQGHGLADWAREARPDAVWSSPLRRARETAEPSAEVLGAPLRVDERLRELDFGVAEGLTRDEMRRRFPDDLDAFLADPVAGSFPRGEDPHVGVERFTGCLRELAASYAGGRVLVVAHSTVVRLVLCALLGIDPARYREVMPELGNCTLNEVALDPGRRDGGAALLSYNAAPRATAVVR